jgi:predicted ribosome quality control (RQC) complex YloA/Tae2 family protein
VSSTIHYDSLLVRHLAFELNRALHGQRLAAVHLVREERLLALQFQDRTLLLESATGVFRWALTTPAAEPIILPRRAAVNAVYALPDERVLRIELTGGARSNAAFVIVVELLGGQRNALVLDEADRVLKQLDAQGRTRQQRGQPYVRPKRRQRDGVTEPIGYQEWVDLLGSTVANERARRLIDRVAYISRINAPTLVDVNDLTAGYERYRQLVTAEPNAFVIRIQEEAQPYGHALWQANAEPATSLVAAIDQAARGAPVAASPVAQLERSAKRVQQKLSRLQAESSSAVEEAAALRSAADLLLAHAPAVKRGSSEVELPGFDGVPVRLQLDPTMTGSEQAQAWYEKARKRTRAGEQLPALIQAAERELADLESLLERARRGEPVEVRSAPPPQRRSRPDPGERLPYRRYRTTGGLEVRVGRNSRSNDELTLKHSSPNDIWLHARATGGSHVVLRWTDANAAPPKQDLLQAAALAALHSKARHAGTVPVDWTRRKYVRKRRNSPAGTVMVERVKTVFVQPSEELEEKLRWRE